MKIHLIEILKRQSVRLSALGVRVFFSVAVLLSVASFGTRNARAQGYLGWPQWMHINGFVANPYSVTAMYFFSPLRGMAATGGSIYYIWRTESPWRAASLPPGVASVKSIRYIQGKLYAAAQGSDILISTDSGHTWNSSGLGYPNANDVYSDASGNIRGLLAPMKSFARLDTMHCIATGPGVIFVSSDGGLTWNTSVTGTDASGTGAFAERCNHVYICPHSPGTALRSTDSGVTWQTVSMGQPPFSEPQHLYGGTNVAYVSDAEHMFRSIDAGLTWKSLITVNGGPHLLFVWGPMDEHVVMQYVSSSSQLWMTSTGGDDFLHSGVNMTDSNGAPLMQQDTFNVPLRLTSRCNGSSIPISFESDVDGMTEHVSIAKDSLGDFALVGQTTITLPRGRDVNFQLAYSAKHPVSTVVLRFDNHWHCSDWSEYRTIIVNAMPEGAIVPPHPLAGSCKPVRQAAFLQIDSCQTLCIDSVSIPVRLSSRLSFDAKLPDTVRAGYKDSIYFTFDPTDTLATIYDSVEIFAHFLGIDSSYAFWDFGLSGGDTSDFSIFNKTVPVKLLAVPQVALVASDTIIALHRASFCERVLDTFVRFSNRSCTKDTITSAQINGLGYSMSGIALPFVLLPDSSVTFALHFRAPDTGVYQGSLDLRVVAGITKTVSIPLTSVGFPTRGILDVRSTSLQAGSFSFCAGDTTLSTAIFNTGCDTLSITNIRVVGDAAFALTSSASDTLLVPNDSLPFTFHFTPRTKGAHQMLVTFHSQNLYGNDAGHDTTISIVGTGLGGTKILSVSSHAIDVGKTYICEERDTFLVIQNIGCDTICVNSLALSPTGFVLAAGTPTTFCISPGERDTIHLRTLIDTLGEPAVNIAMLDVASNADQPLAPIVLSREIEYPSQWALSMSAADSAYAGSEVIYRVIQKGLLASDVSAASVRLSYDADLLQLKSVEEANVTIAQGWRTAAGLMSVPMLVRPLTADSVLATLHFSCYQAPHLSSAVTLDSLVLTSTIGRSADCVASILSPGNDWSSASTFTLRSACATDLLGYPLRGETIRFDGIHPNPATSEITMTYSLPGVSPVTGDISIEDALGREVLRTQVTMQPGINQSQVLSLEGLPSGVYLLRASDGGWSSTWKVIKEQ